ncbi:mitochondrial carrier [Lentinus tigrinus ALCF2SS1-7]|uniref:Mitochondrial carrier n=1 Tax=Lentinus tigrinus ALCF2SS1-6 TaxID=1328759 RepID=A0A5C2S398_9APHY|nr:mitochondrial carrier [Lentinus tigrinus ALCF2SS1-6]RPD72019.1 mitochondrial carrier [Lentinus tigrinus ALCF2SS1-7]
MTSALPPLVQACSGALGSAAANSVSYPLDLVATKLQTTTSRKLRGMHGTMLLLKHILETEGLAGLYDGLGADTASTILSNFLYYYFYTFLHAIVARRRTSASSTSLLHTLKHALTAPTKPVLLGVPTELAVGFVAGVASRAVSTPLSVVTVRLQTEDTDDDSDDESSSKAEPPADEGFLDVVRNIYAEEGLAGFWAGFRPTLPLCLTPALTLLLFQVLSRLRIPWKSPKSRQSAVSAFLSGASANALAVTILYPLLLAKVRVQATRSRSGSEAHATSMTDVWLSAVRSEGWGGLYQALGVQILKGFVSQGVTMLVKQRIERGVVRLYTRG